MKRSMVVAFGVVLMCCTGLVLAQAPRDPNASGPRLMANAEGSDAPTNVPGWGLSSPIAYVVPGWTFQRDGNAQHTVAVDGYFWRSAGSSGLFYQTVHLPSGAVVEGLTLFYYDGNDNTMSFHLARLSASGTTGMQWTYLLDDFSWGSGYVRNYRALAAPEIIRNVEPVSGNTNMYLMWVDLPDPIGGTYSDLRFGGVTVWYRLQMSPAPASATFADVPTGYWAFRHIEALAASGITAGCGGGNYCPESSVTRAEMAVFLAKALGLHWADSN